ncbi:allantoinase-like, partial [Rhododendron vialii]|uniref:allantoinase-like n=1 Tax=Rhododendron vialii TaxID=182163 RepID=UPI00265DD067
FDCREEVAIRELLTVTNGTRTGGPAEGAHLHIVDLSDARSSLELIKEAKRNGDSITVETCTHYLAFSAEEIQDGDTRFKCAPPIRNSANKETLWEALMGGRINLLCSDHSPSVPELKRLDDGNFLKAWGGISSLQFVLPVTWTYGRKYGITLEQLASWWSDKPTKLVGLDLKFGRSYSWRFRQWQSIGTQQWTKMASSVNQFKLMSLLVSVS